MVVVAMVNIIFIDIKNVNVMNCFCVHSTFTNLAWKYCFKVTIKNYHHYVELFNVDSNVPKIYKFLHIILVYLYWYFYLVSKQKYVFLLVFFLMFYIKTDTFLFVITEYTFYTIKNLKFPRISNYLAYAFCKNIKSDEHLQ